MCEFLPNYNTKKTKFISSTLLVSYRIDKGLSRGKGRMVHLLIADYDVSNEPCRQGARAPTSVALVFHRQEVCIHQIGQSLGSLIVFFLTSTTLVFFSGVLTTRDGAKVSF